MFVLNSIFLVVLVINATPHIYNISALKEIIPVLYCSTEATLAQDLYSFLDENGFVTIPTSEKQNSTIDINICSDDTEIMNALSVFRRMLVLLTDHCSKPFIDAVHKLLRVQDTISKVFVLACDTDASFVDEFEGGYLSVTNSVSIKSHALNFLSQPNSKVYSFMFYAPRKESI